VEIEAKKAAKAKAELSPLYTSALARRILFCSGGSFDVGHVVPCGAISAVARGAGELVANGEERGDSGVWPPPFWSGSSRNEAASVSPLENYVVDAGSAQEASSAARASETSSFSIASLRANQVDPVIR
jgi:hypothetical protein